MFVGFKALDDESLGNRPASVPNPRPDLVDEDTGEILDDDPEGEIVDPTDPSAYTWAPGAYANGNQRKEEDVEHTERTLLDIVDAHATGSGRDEIRRTALIAQYSTAVAAVIVKLIPLDPEITARVIGDRHGTDTFIKQTREWLDRFEAARKQTGTIHDLAPFRDDPEALPDGRTTVGEPHDHHR
jgi:hypothetical protein